ncbi:MAG: hypothetical protein GY953_46950 [bacterium]|nr:hypothetical protein [bacterium]
MSRRGALALLLFVETLGCGGAELPVCTVYQTGRAAACAVCEMAPAECPFGDDVQTVGGVETVTEEDAAAIAVELGRQ